MIPLQPAIFFGHGNPMNALQDNNYTRTWKEIVKNIPKPQAILSISAHWETQGVKVTRNETQKTIHDFYGFPQPLFDVEYTPKGNPALAEKILQILGEGKLEDNWGLDHGTWSVLCQIYPNADIPVIQLSLDTTKTPYEHFLLAKKLRFLREEDVLIMGTGNIVHNLRLLDWNNTGVFEWAQSFSHTIKELIIRRHTEDILNYKKIAFSQYAVPTPEHFYPLLYILGLAGENEKITFFNEHIEMGSLDMTGVIIGA